MRKSQRPATILDIAAKAGVSKSSVSLVLRSSASVSEQIAQRVYEAANSLGYVYNRHAAQLRSRSSMTIGVVINDLMNPFFTEVFVGLERALSEHGYTVLLAHTHEDLATQDRLLHVMREHKAAGIALCPALGTSDKLADSIRAWGIPLVVMGRNLGKGHHDYSGSDNRLGMNLAVTHLLKSGHRHIAFLGGQKGQVLTHRLSGYRAALKQQGIGYAPELIVSAHATRMGGYHAISEIFHRGHQVTAAVCYNDLVAFGALAALGERGVRVGRDFALMGFDNVLDAAHSNPPLSTVDIYPLLLGEQAAGLLLARIANPDKPPQHHISRPQLVLRQSA